MHPMEISLYALHFKRPAAAGQVAAWWDGANSCSVSFKFFLNVVFRNRKIIVTKFWEKVRLVTLGNLPFAFAALFSNILFQIQNLSQNSFRSSAAGLGCVELIIHNIGVHCFKQSAYSIAIVHHTITAKLNGMATSFKVWTPNYFYANFSKWSMLLIQLFCFSGCIWFAKMSTWYLATFLMIESTSLSSEYRVYFLLTRFTNGRLIKRFC